MKEKIMIVHAGEIKFGRIVYAPNGYPPYGKKGFLFEIMPDGPVCSFVDTSWDKSGHSGYTLADGVSLISKGSASLLSRYEAPEHPLSMKEFVDKYPEAIHRCD